MHEAYPSRSPAALSAAASFATAPTSAAAATSKANAVSQARLKQTVRCGTLYAALLVVLVFGPYPPESRAQAAPEIVWTDMETALAQSRAQGTPVLAYVAAAWCGLCYRMEDEVFPGAAPQLKEFITAKVDVSERPDPWSIGTDETARYEWMRLHGLDTPPAFAVLSPNGEVRALARGFLTTPQLKSLLRRGADGQPGKSADDERQKDQDSDRRTGWDENRQAGSDKRMVHPDRNH